MEEEKNIVAMIFKVYAILNFVGGFMLAIDLIEEMGILLVGGLLVVSFLIYAIGEVVQLLDDIKQNTARYASICENNGTNTNFAEAETEDKEVHFCPNCGKAADTPGAKTCSGCGQPLEW